MSSRLLVPLLALFLSGCASLGIYRDCRSETEPGQCGGRADWRCAGPYPSLRVGRDYIRKGPPAWYCEPPPQPAKVYRIPYYPEYCPQDAEPPADSTKSTKAEGK